MGTLLALMGVAVFFIGLWGLIFGRVRWARIPSRGIAAGVIGGGFALFIVGGALAVPAGAPVTPPARQSSVPSPPAAARSSKPLRSTRRDIATVAASTPTPGPVRAASPHLGDLVTLPPWSFEALGVRTASSVGDVADGFGDTASGQYVIVGLTASAIGHKAGTLDTSMLKLVDTHGHTYSASTTATMALNGPNKGFFLQQVNPGLSVTGQVAFDVPKGISASSLSLKVSNGIFLATKSADIALSP